MLIYPRTLSLITTHRCTAACDHCCFTCSPEKSDAIPIANLHSYIDQATEINSLQVVVFTGGECFLLGKHLDDLVKRTADNGFLSRFVSNGYWATSVDTASRRLERLFSRGLSETNFSTGDNHAKYVNPEYVRNGAIAAARAGRLALIMVELFEGSTFDLKQFTDHPELKKYIDAKLVIISPSVWMPFNGQTKLSYSKGFLGAGPAAEGSCKSLFSVIAITPTEHLIACCGLTQEYIPELHIGNLRTNTIKEIIDHQPDDFIKIWVHMEGPAAIMRYAASVDPSLEFASGFAHICDICRYMYHHKGVREAIRKSPPPFKDELTAKYLNSVLMGNSYPRQLERQKTLENVELFKARTSLDRAFNITNLMCAGKSEPASKLSSPETSVAAKH